MTKRVTFLGNPDDPRDGRHSVSVFGQTFVLNQPAEVNLPPSAIAKLEGNGHFKVEDVEPRVEGAGAAPKPPSGSRPARSEADVFGETTTAIAHAQADAFGETVTVTIAAQPALTASSSKAAPTEPEAAKPIEIRRERPRKPRSS